MVSVLTRFWSLAQSLSIYRGHCQSPFHLTRLLRSLGFSWSGHRNWCSTHYSCQDMASGDKYLFKTQLCTQVFEGFPAGEHVTKPLCFPTTVDQTHCSSCPVLQKPAGFPASYQTGHTLHFFPLKLEREKISSCYRLHSNFSFIVKKWANNQW